MGEVVQSLVRQAAGPEMVNLVLMMVAMFAIVYFMMIRPQRKQQAEHQSLLAALKKGDEVILSSGLFGRVFAVEDQTVVVEIAERTKVKVLKSAVSTLSKKHAALQSATASKDAEADDDAEKDDGDAGDSAEKTEKKGSKGKKARR